jgi:hypothetical protein
MNGTISKINPQVKIVSSIYLAFIGGRRPAAIENNANANAVKNTIIALPNIVN